ncbi:class II aldolase/adducin family protein [Plasticicumulans acidivorans]|uniref:L-fuculose-phosphate aldolase n=1 Tax=Plasticicumulans acidivorans TaxID=886464 RepID=A0A317MRN0_9GAMM|nr:class II aldolase/adducin family protein [Plasticicumulans acidivorans]PWV58457.1 L-fuculose-phosphate aldolase [Plasticicumulans acidivorans]
MNIKDELVRHYHWLRVYGLNDSHSGNASILDGDTVWVTPTGCCADTLTSGDLIACSDAQIGRGASFDARLHVAVYAANPRMRAILHSHGPYTVAMTMDNEEFVPADFEGQYHFGRVPVITIPFEAYKETAAERVAEVLAEVPIAVVRGHGVFAAAETVNLAYKWTCSLELSAKTAFIAQQAGKI